MSVPTRMRRVACMLFAALVVASAAPVLAAELSGAARNPPALLIEHARARPTPPGVNVAAVYLRIVNAGGADRLLRLSAPVAEQVQLHETRSEQGVMSMRQLPFLDIPANGSIDAAPGGLHIMLRGLKAPLRNGDRFTLTLVFGEAGTLTANVSVRADP